MNLYYYEDKEIKNNRKSIFLAGPTPRSKDVKSWRPEAIKYLDSIGFDGDVFVPEYRTKIENENILLNYDNMIDWELEHLDRATAILFWIPRDLKDMPAFTTNVEFGYHLNTGKVFYGRPNDAPNNRYLDKLYLKHYSTKPFSNLEDLIKHTVQSLKAEKSSIFFTSDTHFGAERTLKFSKRPYKSVEENVRRKTSKTESKEKRDFEM